MGLTCEACLFYFKGDAGCFECLADYSYDFGVHLVPEIGNMAQLIMTSTATERSGIDGKVRLTRDKCNVPTEVYLTIQQGGPPIIHEGEAMAFIAYEEINSIPCPNCDSSMLRNNFFDVQNTAACPRCGEHELGLSGVYI